MYSHRTCSPKTGITLFVNQRGYAHSEPPDVIRTVVVFVDIAARQQRFRAASLLPQMMLANDGPGREPTRCSTVPSPSPPDRDNVLVLSSFGIAPPTATAVVGGCHHSLIIVPLLQPVAVIVLILLLVPERMPMPDRDSCPRRVTYCHRRQPGVENVSRRSIYSLLRPLASIGGAICATYDPRSKSCACVHPSSPPSMPSLIFSPSGS
jgi:hypothetical protein